MEATNTLRPTALELPTDARTHQLALAILTNRAIAQKREHDVTEALGDDASYLCGDLVVAATNEVAAQLLLTEHLTAEGWELHDILRCVWYREDGLRGAAKG